MRQAVWIAAIAMLAALPGCGSSDEPPPPRPAVHAAYVVLATDARGATVALARAIVAPSDPACPALRRGGTSLAMHLRANPFGFPVNVCEARLPFDRRFRLSWNDQPLPIAHRQPSPIVVIGDTGCTGADCPAGTLAAPFAAIAAAAAAQDPAPQLVVHLGDFNYRGTATSVPLRGGAALDVYDAGGDAPADPRCQLDSPYVSQNAAYSANPDTWEHWSEDFFEPAAPLLAQAPWVMVRGNHELCSRAGPGWFYFLDPDFAADLGGRGELSCPPQGDAAPLPPPILPYLVFSPPYGLDLGALHLAVVDSANACDGFAPASTTQIYTQQLADVLAMLPSGRANWIATHRPLWAATEAGGDESDNATLQQAWAATGALHTPPPVALALGGHIHTFQSVAFPDQATPRPPQLVVGASGVALDDAAPAGPFTATLDGESANGLGIVEFLFLRATAPGTDGFWSGTLFSESGMPLGSCGTGNLPDALCVE
ncbi:MAG: metallophosphoesterase [bacterium]